MMIRHPSVTALLAALLLSACNIPGNEDLRTRRAAADARAVEIPGCEAVAENDGPGTGSAEEHGTPERVDGDTTVSEDNGEFHATRTVSIANDFGGAENAQVDLGTVNGDVASCAREGGGYRIHVVLEARGATEADAVAALDSMQITHTDVLTSDGLQLSTRVEGSAPVGSETAATILAGLPTEPSQAFNFITTNGDVASSGFSGKSAQLRSGNGNLLLDGRWDEGMLDTGNGGVDVSGDYASLAVTANNGEFAAVLDTLRSLSADLSLTNGPIDVTLVPAEDSEAGYDLSAQTTNGTASIEVEGTEEEGEQTESSVHRRTPDYDEREVQIRVDASTTNGDVSIHQ